MKIRLLFTVLLLIPAVFLSNSFAKENKAYIGVDYLKTKAKYKYSRPGNIATTVPQDLKRDDNNSDSFAINAGYKFEFKNGLFLAPEIFYDQLNSKIKDYYYPEYAESDQDEVTVNNRVGAKLNLGYNVTEKFNVFVNVGFARVDHDTRWYSLKRQSGGYEVSELYGVGIGYDIFENLSLKASYDNQHIATRYIDQGFRNSIKIEAYKLGVAYNF